jgi:hypothetical protein
LVPDVVAHRAANITLLIGERIKVLDQKPAVIIIRLLLQLTAVQFSGLLVIKWHEWKH